MEVEGVLGCVGGVGVVVGEWVVLGDWLCGWWVLVD